MSSSWSLTESDPGVFTALLGKLGVTGLQLEDLWALDPDLLKSIDPVSLIFLFKHLGNDHSQAGTKLSDHTESGITFARQTVNNSCGSLALLNSVFNLHASEAAPSFNLGEKLDGYKQFAVNAALDPEMLGQAISDDSSIRLAHNSFSRGDPFHIDDSASSNKDKEAAYHFIVFQPVNGSLIELDGLQSAPISHGPLNTDEAWTVKACEVIQNRIASYSSTELNFSLLALVGDKLESLKKRISSNPGDGNLNDLLQDEISKRETWEYENSLRGPDVNLISMVHEVLVQMARRKELDAAVQKAIEIGVKKSTQMQQD